MAAWTGSKPQYHPRLMLALLIYSYANGLFSSRRIERATYRDIAVRFVAANLHPDHDTIATFRRTNRTALETAFLQVLMLADDITALTLQAEAANVERQDPQALPQELARREALHAKLDAACERLEAEARAEAEAARPAYDTKKAAYDAKKGRRGRPPKPPDGTSPPEQQSNLTDPDSALMLRSDAHAYRQAYNT